METFRRHVTWILCAFALFLCASANAEEQSRLTIQSTPPGATVLIDGKKLNVKTPVRVNVSPGRHSIKLEKEGYKSASRDVEVYSGTGFASFSLSPLSGAPAPAKSETKSPPPRTADSSRTPAALKPESRKPAPASAPKPSAVSKPPAPTPVRQTPSAKKEKDQGEIRTLGGPDHSRTAPVPEPSSSHHDSWSELLEAQKILESDSGAKKPADDHFAAEPGAKDEFEIFNENAFPLVVRRDNSSESGAASSEETAENAEELDPPASDPPAAESFDPIAGEEAPSSQEEAADPEKFSPESAKPGAVTFAPESELDWPKPAEQFMYETARQLPHFPEKFNILLLGLDRRDRKGILATGAEIPVEVLKRKPANSDVIVVVQLDLVEKKVRIVSIPRDTKVYVPGRGNRKANAAYAYGRERLAKRVVENFLKIPIHRTVVVDWRGAKKGIAMFKSMGLDYMGFSEKELFWHLRKRSFNRGDFRRIERQQQFLRYAGGEFLRLYKESLAGVRSHSMVKKNMLDMAIIQGMEVVETDLTFEEINLLTYAFREYNINDVTMAQVRGRGGLERSGPESSGVYFFRPYKNQTFDEIVARAEDDKPE